MDLAEWSIIVLLLLVLILAALLLPWVRLIVLIGTLALVAPTVVVVAADRALNAAGATVTNDELVVSQPTVGEKGPLWGLLAILGFLFVLFIFPAEFLLAFAAPVSPIETALAGAVILFVLLYTFWLKVRKMRNLRVGVAGATEKRADWLLREYPAINIVPLWPVVLVRFIEQPEFLPPVWAFIPWFLACIIWTGWVSASRCQDFLARWIPAERTRTVAYAAVLVALPLLVLVGLIWPLTLPDIVAAATLGPWFAYLALSKDYPFGS